VIQIEVVGAYQAQGFLISFFFELAREPPSGGLWLLPLPVKAPGPLQRELLLKPSPQLLDAFTVGVHIQRCDVYRTLLLDRRQGKVVAVSTHGPHRIVEV
jgi:hypothetical protein